MCRSLRRSLHFHRRFAERQDPSATQTTRLPTTSTRIEADVRGLIGFFGFVFVPSLVTLLLGYSGRDLTWMSADRSTLPFGIVTANFINQDLEHFALNMGLFVLFLWGFAVVNSYCAASKWRELVL